MSFAALLSAVALQAVPLPSPLPSVPPCAPTVLAAWDPTVDPKHPGPVFDSVAYRGYAFAMWTREPQTFALSAWFKRRAARWCLLGTAGDAIDTPDAVRFGVPEPIATRLVDLFEAAYEAKSKQ